MTMAKRTAKGAASVKGGRPRGMTNEEFLKTAAGQVIAAQESLIVDTTELLATAMRVAGVTRAELARRMEIKPPVVTEMLKGERNFSLRTLAAAFHALGYGLEVKAKGLKVPAKMRKGWERQGLD